MSENVWLFLLSGVSGVGLIMLSWLARSVNNIEKTLPRDYVLKSDYQKDISNIGHKLDRVDEKQDKILDKLDTKQDKPRSKQ